MKTFAVANHKGGAGKTSVAVHLATGLTRRGYRVLAVDLDPQGSMTRWLLPGTVPSGGAAAALKWGRIRDEYLLLADTSDSPLVLPATESLRAAEVEAASMPAGQLMLRRALIGVRPRFDYAIIDCPPTLGTLTIAGVAAADAVVAPVLPGFMSLAGLADLERRVEEVRVGFNVAVSVCGYVLFNVDTREGVSEATRVILREHAKKRLLRSEIRVSTAAKGLPGKGRTAWDEGADERGYQDYQALLDELVGPKRKTTKRVA